MKVNPCKYCGAKPIAKTAIVLGLRWYQCKNCKKNMSTMEYNLTLAKEAWNAKNSQKAQEEE